MHFDQSELVGHYQFGPRIPSAEELASQAADLRECRELLKGWRDGTLTLTSTSAAVHRTMINEQIAKLETKGQS